MVATKLKIAPDLGKVKTRGLLAGKGRSRLIFTETRCSEGLRLWGSPQDLGGLSNRAARARRRADYQGGERSATTEVVQLLGKPVP